MPIKPPSFVQNSIGQTGSQTGKTSQSQMDAQQLQKLAELIFDKLRAELLLENDRIGRSPES